MIERFTNSIAGSLICIAIAPMLALDALVMGFSAMLLGPRAASHVFTGLILGEFIAFLLTGLALCLHLKLNVRLKQKMIHCSDCETTHAVNQCPFKNVEWSKMKASHIPVDEDSGLCVHGYGVNLPCPYCESI